VVSWSSVDGEGRWKALQYRAAHVFAPVAVLADVWADTVAVWVAADPGGATAGALTVRVRDFAGTVLSAHSAAVAFDGSRSIVGWRGTVEDILPPGVDPRDVWVEAVLSSGGAALRDAAFLVPPRNLRLPDPGLRVVAVEPDGAAWTVRLTAERFAYAVRLSLDGVGARISENFFHLPAGDTVRVRVEPDAPTPDLAERLRVRWLGAR
jgi:beta-mannosidase